MQRLAHKRLILGLTGGIACYKSAEFLRRAQDQGAQFDVVMTAGAQQFITPITFKALSGRPVHTDLWDNSSTDNMAHIHLSREADAIIIAPASTNFIAKLAQGVADDLLSTLCIARGHCPLIVAPAMNKEMWAHPATQRNLAQLQADGVHIIGPGSGDQACGEIGDGRMLEPHQLLAETIAFFEPKTLAGKKVLITAGPTSEPIDPIRTITNRSSGKMGYAIAEAAFQAGADVHLVSGPVKLDSPYGVKRISVESAREMQATVMGLAPHADVFISVAAVADWYVSNASTNKFKKDANQQAPALEFAPNPDILAGVAAMDTSVRPYCVGFAAETENLLAFAEAKRVRKAVPLLVANLAQVAMDKDDTELLLVHEQGHEQWAPQSKQEAAQHLVQYIARQLHS
ncbi:phosphopantothenoylcysteine decarboxylase/phosphopantothenate--cysteine ligase [Paenalcaligenes hominis]|uniref:Coenzyme A biosynthesis bifunctional protein CoaBC n=1 Tax=Paenalcaligenes hominis TaxID=643674 RepID=A0ABX0WME6_9BURK|nr:bifunctional phosphopantothenoylcysteine decarboxylase/phosphopantothenate--cysteine ligase CoaBC [Paenalcaligenes hominis]NJB64216.1 phosphopantothenoylcysteine decarboxylase/phosphopantothenate--cysteine ligase [Paenalcaligenes hominis]GGE69323.1 DNA/pantothenate metabolism flavoprotein [Paenalcaligenes hominis]